MAREYPARPLIGVGAVIWRGEHVLLVRRAKAPRRGRWSLPGGAQRLGETVEAAIRREVREETGLELDSLEFIAAVDLIERDEAGRVRYHYTLIDATAEAAAGEPVPGDDVDDARWFALDELDGLALWSETLRVIALAAGGRRPPAGRTEALDRGQDG